MATKRTKHGETTTPRPMVIHRSPHKLDRHCWAFFSQPLSFLTPATDSLRDASSSTSPLHSGSFPGYCYEDACGSAPKCLSWLRRDSKMPTIPISRQCLPRCSARQNGGFASVLLIVTRKERGLWKSLLLACAALREVLVAGGRGQALTPVPLGHQELLHSEAR